MKRIHYIATTLILVALLLSGIWFQNSAVLSGVNWFLQRIPEPLHVIGTVFQPFRNALEAIATVKQTAERNTNLEKQLQSYLELSARSERLALENEQLRTNIGMQKKESRKTIPCDVISYTPSILGSGLLLNCGTNRGVAAGQLVVLGNMAIGKVLYTNPTGSTVRLLSDTSSAVDVLLPNYNLQAVVRGSSGSGLLLDLVPQTVDLKPGDVIVTAGITNPGGSGLVVGSVDTVLYEPGDLFKRATVLRPNNLEITQVLVLP